MADEIGNSTEAFEQALQEASKAKYVLRLYISGNTPASQTAIINLRRVCEEKLKGRYQLEVVDIQQQPALAKRDQIIAVPTLIKRLPSPLKKMIGDLSKTERLLVGLDLIEAI
jgi:circadian clock protein KaiB